MQPSWYDLRVFVYTRRIFTGKSSSKSSQRGYDASDEVKLAKRVNKSKTIMVDHIKLQDQIIGNKHKHNSCKLEEMNSNIRT